MVRKTLFKWGRGGYQRGIGTPETEFDRRERFVSTPNTAWASGN